MAGKINLCVVAGPTASGKTDVAIQLAKRFDGEVVSADSMQIYRGLSIATAKPSREEMQGITHHLMDFLEPDTGFSVAQYVQLAATAVEQITQRGHLPILCGGTGLYIHSLVDNITFAPMPGDRTLREMLLARAQKEGGLALLQELAQKDPQTAQRLHPNDITRIVRALEILRLTGVPMSEWQKNSRNTPSPYRLCMIGLDYTDRQKLYNRINQRVDRMLKQGLVKEAKYFYSLSNADTAAQAIGYKELKPYLDGQISLEEAAENLKRETRRYAKRQLTWLRRDDRIHWVKMDEEEPTKKILKIMQEFMENYG